MKKNILSFLLSAFLGAGAAVASDTLWEGPREEVAARIKSHTIYFAYEELEALILPVLHSDLHGDFKEGFGALFKEPKGRLPAPKENSHIACLYESLYVAQDFEMQKITLFSRLSVPAHLAYFTEDFVRKIQS